MPVEKGWSDYWAAAGNGAACFPHGPAAINQTLEDFWRRFAHRLPKGAAVADLCCGNGAVLRVLARARDDLSLSGFDYAQLAAESGTIALHGGVDCAHLPLPNQSHHAVTSQFGLEYAGTQAWAEAARIRRPDGVMAMIVHHADGVLVRSNMRRLSALSAFLDNGLFARAHSVAQGGQVHDIAQIMADLARDHAGQSVVAELFRAVQHAVKLGPTAPATLHAIERTAFGEKSRLQAMRDAALDTQAMREFARIVAGGREVAADTITVAGHGLIAWSVIVG